MSALAEELKLEIYTIMVKDLYAMDKVSQRLHSPLLALSLATKDDHGAMNHILRQAWAKTLLKITGVRMLHRLKISLPPVPFNSITKLSLDLTFAQYYKFLSTRFEEEDARNGDAAKSSA